MDYIQHLNLEELPLGSSPVNNSSDLASFTDSTFFDFDQFHSDSSLKFTLNDSQQQSTQVPSDLPSNLDTFFNTSFVKQEEVTQQIPQNKRTAEVPDESEQDKKKRNTLASARFRVKKKLKEQEMERTVKMLSERIAAYNERINHLELENSCLKSLILEKNEQKSNELLRSIKEKSLQ
jgi:hypothetical protein